MEERILNMAVLTKLEMGEPMSEFDVQRLIKILSRPIQLSSPSTDQGQALYTQLRTVLRNVYFNDGK